MPSTLRFGTDADYENAANLREEFKRYMQGVTQSIPTPRTSTMEAALPKERIEAAKVEGDPLALALPTISSGPQEFAAKIIESLKRDPRMFDWFNKTFAKQEAVSTLGNPVMGFHGTNKNFPLSEIRGANSHVIDQSLGPHMAVDPDVASQFAIHKGYSVNNLDKDFDAQMSTWLKSAEDVGFGNYMSRKLPQSKYQAYNPVGGQVIPAFLKTENPYIIKQGWNPTEFMPKPTPMLSRGGDVHPAGMEVSPNFTPTPSGLMNDSNSIHRDFFQTLFQDTPKETALNNVRDWTGNRKAGNTMLLSKAAEKHDQGMLGQYMSEFYGPSGATESTMPLFIDKYKQTLRRKGHDSIMYHNTVEAPGNLDPRTFIMIEPNNIISPFDFEKLRRMGGR